MGDIIFSGQCHTGKGVVGLHGWAMHHKSKIIITRDLIARHNLAVVLADTLKTLLHGHARLCHFLPVR